MSEEIVWQSTITRDMVKDWIDDEIAILIADLDDAVQMTCEDNGVE